MSESLTLPLRPISGKHEHADLLPVHIAQISSQWGSFRDVSEETLRADIESARKRELEPETTADADRESGELDATERLDRLYKRRAEITQFALYDRPFLRACCIFHRRSFVCPENADCRSDKRIWRQCSRSTSFRCFSLNIRRGRPKHRSLPF